MKTSELKIICESLINTFNQAGKTSIDLFKKGLKIEIIKECFQNPGNNQQVNE